jgi:integrase
MSEDVDNVKPRQKAKAWSKSFGEYGASIRLYEAESGIIYHEHRGHSASLRHRDRKAAERWAKEQIAKWMLGESQERDLTPTCTRLVAAYLTHQTSQKSKSEQKADKRRSRMFTRWLGPEKDLSKITLGEWNGFVAARSSGAINAAGDDVPDEASKGADEGKEPTTAAKTREAVRAGTVAADLVWLRTVLNFATKWQNDDGRYLLRENVTRGFPMPVEKNPTRVVISHDRFLKIRAVAAKVMTVRGHRGAAPEIVPSYLPAILDIAEMSGRRISAILRLQFKDLKLNEGEFGFICWPAASDKCRKAWTVPMSRELRDVIDSILRDRLGIGEAYLFPAINEPSKPVAVETATGWLDKAEALASLPKLQGSRWHCFRRKWAMERKGLPITDVAAAGGWSDHSVLTTIYQQPDPATMARVMTAPTRLRDVR